MLRRWQHEVLFLDLLQHMVIFVSTRCAYDYLAYWNETGRRGCRCQ